MSGSDQRGVLPVTRRAALLEELRRNGIIRISELTDRLGVTAVTLRRDITQLVDEGLVRRVHGGATLLTPAQPDDDPPAVGAGRGALGVLGVLVPSLDYYWPEVVRAAEDVATNHGLRVVLRGSSYDGDDDEPQLRRLLEQPGVAGLLAAPSPDGPTAASTMRWLADTDLPVVLLERAVADGAEDRMDSVVTDHALGAAMAVRHLAGLGHRRIGIVVDERSPTAPQLHLGWSGAVDRLGRRAARGVDARVPPPGARGLGPAMAAVLQDCLATGTTALLVHADAEAVALVQHAEQLGIRVPADLSVVAYDDAVAELFTPRLTAVRPPRRSVGRAAVGLLVDRLADPDRPTHHLRITPALHLRDSTAAPPG